MSDLFPFPELLRRVGVFALVFALGPVAGLPGTGPGQQANAGEGRPAVAKLLTPKGTLVARAKPGADWKLVDQGQPLYAGDLLMGPGAQLETRNGAVRLAFLGDPFRLSPHPVIESAVVLHANPKADLDFTLDRGRVDLTNAKARGAAKVVLHVRDQTWEFTLDQPGTAVALQLFGRWPAGTKFTKHPGPKDVPTADLVGLVLKGEVIVGHGDHERLLTAPPGPAQVHWNSVTGPGRAPEHLDRLPDWAQPESAEKISPEERAKLQARRQRFRNLLVTKSLGAALDEFLSSKDPDDRRMAVFAMAAVDDLKRLGQAYITTKQPDVLDDCVLALRHWLGRGPGQDLKLYNVLVKEAKVPEAEAETIVQLLHSFSAADLAEPETYETLVDYLGHDRLAIRALAYWHLSRLLPAGRQFGYDPLAPEAARDKAVAKWQTLIPKKKGKKP